MSFCKELCRSAKAFIILRGLRCVLCGFVSLFSGGPIAAEAAVSVVSPNALRDFSGVLPSSPPWEEDTAGPFCGIYAACAALRASGIAADPEDFIATKYVGACGGSTPAELSQLLADAGCDSTAIARLSSFDLWLVGQPLLAFVRRDSASTRFNHWVLVVPESNGVMTVYDGPDEAYELTTAEFLGIWSGLGLYICDGSINPLAIIWSGRISLLFGATCLVLLLITVFRRYLSRVFTTNTRIVSGLLAASTILCVSGNTVFGDLSNHSRGVRVASGPFHKAIRKTGTLYDAERASKSSSMLLVDARRARDFRLGSIAGSVNIPVSASTWAIAEYVQKLDRNTPIVVFCQSAYCPYDDEIGAKLESLGFTNVTVCNEGWLEYNTTWSSRNEN